MAYHIQVLKDELEQRKARRPQYSLRAFARQLELDPGDLSRILSGKLPLPVSKAINAVRFLQLDRVQRETFLESLCQERKRHIAQRSIGLSRSKIPSQAIDNELFAKVSDLDHCAILELTYVDEFQSDATWISDRLGLSLERVELCLEQLIQAGMLERHPTKGLVKSQRRFTTGDKRHTSEHLQRFQRDGLSRAIDALGKQQLDRRSMTSMTMPIDPELLPLAKFMIQEFMDELCTTLSSVQPKEVYHLAVALFSLEDRYE